jgi:uncharacterized protein YfaP (DUF2135 family)
MWRHSAFFSAVLALCTLGADALAQSVDLKTPAGGWHSSSMDALEDKAAVAYPYNLIDRGAQKYRTLIQGQLKGLKTAAGKAADNVQSAQGDAPGPKGDTRSGSVLVVNGNPMPLYTGEDGEFARPYAFGRGSNSVEIRNGRGAPMKRVQFYETPAGRPQAGLRIIAAWDDNQAEVDMHIITPDGQHAFWANPVLQGGGGLDVDSVDGAGPEMFSITSLRKGTYHVFVNYWGNFGSSGYHFDESTRKKPVITVRLTLVFNENTLNERRETLVVPLRKIGDLTLVKSVVL